MDIDTGEIIRMNLEDHKKAEIVINDRGDRLIPLTNEQERVLTPLTAEARKGYMRNQPCVCGSGQKFKKCCWSKFK